MYICTYIICMHNMYAYYVHIRIRMYTMYVHIALMYGYVGDMWSCGHVRTYVRT